MTPHPLTNMPPHRQQFMPHPKTSIIFPSPHIPPPPLELHQTQHQSPSPSVVGPPLPSTETDDDSRLSDRSSSVGPSGEETETAPEGEGDDLPTDDSITRCVCDFSHDDGYMIQCDRCFVWQHVDCMEIDRNNIPDEYLCEACDPRPIDRFKARALQIRRRQEIKAHLARLSSSDSEDNIPTSTKSRGSLGKVQERKVKKKKVKQIKDMKNGRKGGSSLALLKKSSGGSGSSNTATTTTACNNSLPPGPEDKDRRMVVKRRRKSNSMSGGEGVSDDSSGGGPVERLRAWVEGYEAAVTNHYSPELRARVHAARINGVSPDLRASTQGAVLGHRCRVADNPRPLFDVFDSKILVAATRLSPNTAITEFQGKYLLASQWNAQQPVSGQPYLPYVLQYHMPKEGLTVCVDARTYGNDARFTRRSCTPNSEVRHVVERGSLHLYIVASREIEEGEEVTLALETANSSLELVCCLAEEHDCHAPVTPRPEHTSPVPTLAHKKNGLIVSNKKTLKKQQLQLQLRTSKRTASADTRPVESASSVPVTPSTPVTTVKQRRASGCGKSPVKSPSITSLSSSPEEGTKDLPSASTGPSTGPSTGTPPAPVAVTPPDTPRTALDKQQQQKMTREERKIAAYMKAFERLEKAAQRKQEMEKKKEEDKGREVREPKDKEKKRCDGDEEDWEKTSSADECVRSLAGADRCRRKGKKGRGKGSPQKRNNHRADSAASDLTGDESSCASVGLMSPGGGTIEGITLNFNSPPQGNPNAMGFRFPKTKKALMNEWLNENVDPVVPAGSVVGTDLPSGVPTCYMRSPAMPLRRPSLNQTTGPGTLVAQDMPGGSAKKRWLRQAISEETETPQLNGLCPSPNSRPDSPTGGGDYITPLKKRRLARESMSSELSSTPPSTPVHSTSLEEDKMTEEMEAELAEEDDPSKSKSDHGYPEDLSSPSARESSSCRGFSRSPGDVGASRLKRVIVQQEETDDLVIDEGGSFFDQGSGAVNFSKVVRGQLSSGLEEGGGGGGGIRGKSRRAKIVRYQPEDGDDDDEEEEEEEEEDAVEDSREQVKVKRRQYSVKKGRSQQLATKRGKRPQGATKKGRQDTGAKGEGKRRKPLKRGKEEVPPKEEDEEEEEGEEEEEEEEADKLLRIKKEQCKEEIKMETEVTPKRESVEPKRETERQKLVKTERMVKEQEEEGEKKAVVVKAESQDTLTMRSDVFVKVKEEKMDLAVGGTEASSCGKGGEKYLYTQEVHNQDLLQSVKKEEEEENSRERLRHKTWEEIKDGEEESSENREEQLYAHTEHTDCPQTKQEPESKDDVEEDGEVLSPRGEDRQPGKKPAAEKVTKKLKKTQRQIKKEEEQGVKRRKGKETKQKMGGGKKEATPEAKKIQEIKTEKELDRDDYHEDERREEHQPSTVSAQEPSIPTTLVIKEKAPEEPVPGRGVGVEEPQGSQGKTSEREMAGESLYEGPVPVSTTEVKDVTNAIPTPMKGDTNTTLIHAKDDKGDPPSLTKGDVNSTAPPLTRERPEELTPTTPIKPPTPPTLFPPLPWQTSKDDDPEKNSTRFKSPEGVGYLGMRGPRTPEGPAPTSPPDLPTSPQSSPPGSPLPPALNSPASQEKKPEESRTVDGDSTPEGAWRTRGRGPCTPPSPHPHRHDETLDEEQQEGNDDPGSPQSHLPSHTEQTQTRPAPIKKKLSILEYRKRKSVGGEAGPLDSSPPPGLPPHRSASCGDSSGGFHEPSGRGNLHSPSHPSPQGPAGGSIEGGDSSPDLPLSPMGPILLPPSPINFDTRNFTDETKREGECYRGSSGGTGSSGSDLGRHSIIAKSSSSSNNSSSSVTGGCAVSEASTTATTTANVTTTATHTLLPITGGTAQDVKWNAAPTLLERQRENLTARLRREFGLCVSDDDDDKSGLRLGCTGVLSRPSPPLLPPSSPLGTTGPLSPRVRKPPVLVGPACLNYLPDGEERVHRRHKERNLPPPPPPPTAPPKNSIFQGREVTVQKVVCAAKVVPTVPSQPAGGGGPAVAAAPTPAPAPAPAPAPTTQRLLAATGLYQAPSPVLPSVSCVRSGSSSQVAAQPATPSITVSPAGAAAVPCPVPPPMPAPAVVQAGLAVLPAGAHSLPGLPPSKQTGPCLSSSLATASQNPEYPSRSFPRSQYSAPGGGPLAPAISLYSSGRLGPPPPPPPPLPLQTDPAGTGPQGPVPPGHADGARVGGEGGAGYSGQDCPAPGTRGS